MRCVGFTEHRVINQNPSPKTHQEKTPTKMPSHYLKELRERATRLAVEARSNRKTKRIANQLGVNRKYAPRLGTTSRTRQRHYNTAQRCRTHQAIGTGKL